MSIYADTIAKLEVEANKHESEAAKIRRTIALIGNLSPEGVRAAPVRSAPRPHGSVKSSILEAMADGSPVQARTIADRLNMVRSTAAVYLSNLAKDGAIYRASPGIYRIAPASMANGNGHQESPSVS